MAAMEKGESIWIERQEATKNKKPRKGGKKGQKGGRQSRVSDVKQTGEDAAKPSSPAASNEKETGTKRKYDEEASMVSGVLLHLMCAWTSTDCWDSTRLTTKHRTRTRVDSPQLLPVETRDGSRVSETCLMREQGSSRSNNCLRRGRT